MHSTYQYPTFPYRISADQRSGRINRYPVIVAGAGPVGLSAAIDLAQHGIPVVVLDDDDSVSVGSRAICFSKRTLEIFDRLGCAQPMVDKGVVWNLGKVFFRDRQVYSFNLLPETGHQRPAFINLQQYYVEDYLVQRAGALANIDLRWQNEVIDVQPQDDHVVVSAQTPDGVYQLQCDYLIAADGARSPIRHALGLESKGQIFRDKFLIADIVMKADFPTERWFWFDPPFHRGQSTLLHKQADDVWRLDFQLGWEADAEYEKQPENVIPRVRAMLGDDIDFELEWCSVYTFTCRRMDRFRHGRVFFVGDAAHLVSPFGARGCNGGVQDTDNLCWKLKLVLTGKAPAALLDSYDAERIPAADENIMNSTRSTDFITPKNDVSRVFRDAVLELSERQPFARSLVNSGRLSLPYTAEESPLNTADEDHFDGAMVPGAPCCDAPVVVNDTDDWLLRRLGNEFIVLCFVEQSPDEQLLQQLRSLADAAGAIAMRPLLVARRAVDAPADIPVIVDHESTLHSRYDAGAGTTYLIRPDQHVAARWRGFDRDKISVALVRATGQRQMTSTS
jgi:3-(3-hydroxy-phenyl)propionate hydroxylase